MGEQPHPIQFGGFTVDPEDRRLIGPGGPIHLGGRAFDILWLLLEAGGRLVTKDQLFADVWNGLAVSDAALTSAIRELRIALGDHSKDGMIRAVYGQGYRLEADHIDHRASGGPSSAPAPKPPVPRLAVLPFDDLSPAGDMAYFSDGISEEILSILTRGSDIRTLSKLSSFAFRGSRKSEAMRELQVSHLLDGSVRKADDRVRITAHLLMAPSGETLWSESFEHPQADLMETQLKIARAIAASLEQQFAHRNRGDIDPEVYELYLRAKDMSSASAMQLVQLASLEHVTREAPDFAAGWGALASALAVYRLASPIGRWPALIAQARGAIKSALHLDPGEPGALMAELQLMEPFGDFDEQKRTLAKLEPEVANTALFHHMQAWHYANTGQLHNAINIGLVAKDLEPSQAQMRGFRGCCLYYAGLLEEARGELLECVERDPANGPIVTTLVNCAAVMKDRELFDELTDPERLARYPLGDPATQTMQVEIARMILDDDREGRERLARSIEHHVKTVGRTDLLSAIYMAEGSSAERCHDVIAEVAFGPNTDQPAASDFIAFAPMLLFIKSVPAIRQDRRFATLCARLGLAQFWTKHDIWPDCADSEDWGYDFRSEIKLAAKHTLPERLKPV